MDDQLDNDLKNRIKEVFNNYEDTSADEGWLQLRKKYPEKAKRIIAAWVYWAPIAAVLLVFLGILWFKATTPKQQQQQVAVTKPQPAQPVTKKDESKKNDAIVRDSSTLQQNGQAIAKNSQEQVATQTSVQPKLRPVRPSKEHQYIALNQPEKTSSSTGNTVNSLQSTDKANKVNTIAMAKVQTQVTAPENSVSSTTVASKNAATTPSNSNVTLIARVDSGSKSPANVNNSKSAPEVNMIAQQPNNNTKQVLADNTSTYKKQKPLSANKPISFAVYTTTYINYAKGSNHQFNMGAGLSSDIKLTNNLLFSTGISVTQNSLNYAGQPPVTSVAAAPVAAADLAPASLSASRYAFTANNTPPSLRNYSASLVGLDIPLNVKFVFDPQKTGTYFLAGLSSGTYINETYTYSYVNPSLFSANVSQIQDQSTRSSFNGFYFAKTLNVALGTSYMIGHSRLVVEPFLKYPLEGLGSQQLRFGSSGVNLKFNFNGFKR